MKKVSKIEATKPVAPRLMKVAAYARVSAETDRTMHSLSAQISFYSDLIQKTPGWQYVGVYADNFISGTEIERRPEFKRLLQDCEDGKIDIVLTKSISRFARNTVDLLETVRHLKELGIEVRFPCKKGRVLYVNLEIDPASAINRFLKIYEALGIPIKHSDDIVIWNLRGHAVPLDQLVPKLIRRVRDQHFDAIIIDPIYKVITGDENNASEMGAFCNQFDKICTETGCSTIYCHHHSKGAQGAKRAMDRASGSGVFARDPDAQLDMIQLELSDDLKNNVRDGNATAWRLESSLREFPNIVPVNFWFEYPIHRIDNSGELDAAYAEGSPMGNLSRSKKYTTAEERKAAIDAAYDVCSIETPVPLEAMAEYMGVSVRCARDRIKECKDEYVIKGGFVAKVSKTENRE